MCMREGDLESRWSQPLTAVREKINTPPLVYLQKGLTQTFISHYGTRDCILPFFVLPRFACFRFLSCFLVLCHTLSRQRCIYLTWESPVRVSENIQAWKAAGVTALHESVAEVLTWYMVGRADHASKLLCSGSTSLYLLYFDKAKEAVRRQSGPNFCFFMETKKSHTDKLSVLFQGVQALKSRIVDALQLYPNEVSVSLLFHINAQWPCDWNPDLK